MWRTVTCRATLTSCYNLCLAGDDQLYDPVIDDGHSSCLSYNARDKMRDFPSRRGKFVIQEDRIRSEPLVSASIKSALVENGAN